MFSILIEYWINQIKIYNSNTLFKTIIIEYNDMFTRHRLDIGINIRFKVKITKKNNSSVYTQSLAVPINVIEDLTVALESMQKYTIITTLPFSKPANLISWATQPKRQMKTCWPTDDKRVRIRRLHQQQPPRQLIVRCSLTLAEDINYHNTWFQNRQHTLWGVTSVS